MYVAQIKEEIRELNRIDKADIHRWIDEEFAVDLLLDSGSLDIGPKRRDLSKS
jgi:hypothetical protein